MQENATDVHGHEVMRMMLESGQAYDRDTLEAAILERFGTETRFCTCSASGMTASQLIDFLAQRGKFVPTGEGFSTDPGKICDH
ncbi:YecH family metal-binding protein [Aeoliella sp.]|uniref:YecH family metal-binding protein n=1 Tax=Aeoliella sp. TaxID=2795800 RepID=UPI003CCB9D5E